MAGWVDTEEQKLLDHWMNKTTYTPVATKYLALSTTTPTEAAGNFTEPSGNAYARVSTVAADWAAASGTAPASTTNTAVKTFPAATGSWGTVTYFGFYDALTVGNLLCFGALGTAQAIASGNTPSFAASALLVQLGDPGDTY